MKVGGAVVEAMVVHAIAQPGVVDQNRCEMAARSAIDRFVAAYGGIDWRVHGCLVHFRNLGIAHLTLQELERSITYAELERLVRAVVTMAEALVLLVDNAFPVSEGDLDEYANRAAEVWRAVIDETSDPAGAFSGSSTGCGQ
jgi:hypothetical protein